MRVKVRLRWTLSLSLGLTSVSGKRRCCGALSKGPQEGAGWTVYELRQEVEEPLDSLLHSVRLRLYLHGRTASSLVRYPTSYTEFFKGRCCSPCLEVQGSSLKDTFLASCYRSEAGAMSVLHRLAGRLFQRGGPCLGNTSGGEGRHCQPQEEPEVHCWSE